MNKTNCRNFFLASFGLNSFWYLDTNLNIKNKNSSCSTSIKITVLDWERCGNTAKIVAVAELKVKKKIEFVFKEKLEVMSIAVDYIQDSPISHI